MSKSVGNYRIYPAIRRVFCPSRVTSNNLTSPMKFCNNTNFTLPKQSQRSRSIFQDGSRSSGLFWKENNPSYNRRNTVCYNVVFSLQNYPENLDPSNVRSRSFWLFWKGQYNRFGKGNINAPDKKDGWMDDLQFYILFNSISVISGRWADDNERLFIRLEDGVFGSLKWLQITKTVLWNLAIIPI